MLLLFCGAAGAQTINIPDANFKARLLAASTTNGIAHDVNNLNMVVDANMNGEIEQDEALLVYQLNLTGQGVASMEGIQYFTNLKGLYVPNNNLTSLDVTPLVNLQWLHCHINSITDLNIDGLAHLNSVNCSSNPIASLSTSNLPALVVISAGNTLINEIDLSGSPILGYFDVYDCPLLTKVNIRNGSLIEYPFECSLENCPNLQFMCVDEGEDVLMLENFEANQIVPPYMSTDCSFVPGMTYNTITGQLTYDFDGDGCDDNDSNANYTPVVISNGMISTTRYANAEGEYFIYAAPGEYTITPQLDNNLFVATPASGNVSFPGYDGTVQVQDFCIAANGVHPDVEVTIATAIPARPGFNAVYRILVHNKGNQTLSGEVSFTYDDTRLDFVSASPAEDTAVPGNLTWNYTGLLPFETRMIILTLDVNAPTDTPAVNIDDILEFSASVTPLETDDNPEDNEVAFSQVVVGSFDPNNIICHEGDVEDVEAIGEYLHYTVNFENTGTGAAEFIVITQQISPGMFDLSSLQVLGSTHNVETTLAGNNLEFRFDDIQLGPQATGSVTFRIRTLASLEEGDTVMNKANIVFDYNFGIPTNEAPTTFEQLMGNDEAVAPATVSVYPNPSRNIINVSSLHAVQSLELYDLNGRLLQTSIVDGMDNVIDISGRAAGIYLLKVATDKGSHVAKIIRE